MTAPETPANSPRSATRLVVIVAGLTFPSLVTWIYFVALAGSASGWQQIGYAAGKCVQFAFPAVWVFAILRRPLRRPVRERDDQDQTGHSGPGPGLAIVPGLAFGVLVTVAGYLLFRFALQPAGLFDSAEQRIVDKVLGMGISAVGPYLALSVFYSVVHSFLEEYYWRWFVFDELRSAVSLPAAVGISSIGFAAHHVIVLAQFFGWGSAATWLFSAAVAIGGAVWAGLFHRTGSLVAPWLSHLVVDAGIFLIGFELVRSQF